MYFESLDLENIHNEGHTHNSTGHGIHPINGIKKLKFDNFHGLIFDSNQLALRDSLIGLFIKSDTTANKVRKVNRVTRNLEILSSALYSPTNKIKPQITSIPMDKSIGGKLENKGMFVRRTPVTKLTAAIVKVPVIKLTIRKIGK